VDKVFTFTFYSTGLVQLDDQFLSPIKGPWQISLADGTQIGLDTAGMYIGWDHRVPYPQDFLPIIAGYWLPPQQVFL
jgi:hypothetical protein